MLTLEEFQQKETRVLLDTYRRYPIALVKGKGTKVWDIQGKEYLDFLSGIAVCPLGHCHPQVTEAIIDQVNTLMHTSNLFYTEPCIKLAEQLIHAGGLDKVFFCNSGTEANEGAIKLARSYQSQKGFPNKWKIVTATGSFHGRTLGSLAATAKPEIKQGFGPLPEGFEHAAWNNPEELFQKVTNATAAVILEPVQGEGGVCPASAAFLQAAKEACQRTGALLIFDEIQCGLGRLGTFFAYQAFGVCPDVITLAKGLGNGFPIGAICVTENAASGFKKGFHGTTFGGNPLASAAALATVKTILSLNLSAQAQEKGKYLTAKLKELQKLHPDLIQEVRGLGLMIGVEVPKDHAEGILHRCFEKGLIINLTAGNVLRFLPPYIVSTEEIDAALALFTAALLEHL